MKIALPSISKNLSVINAGNIAQICAPLFRNSQINYFAYYRVFQDKSYYTLSNDHSWTEHFYYTQYPGPGYNKKPYQTGFNFAQALLNVGLTEECLTDMRQGFNLHNLLAFVENGLGYYDMYLLATSRLNGDYLNFYLNHIEIIKKFFTYFKETAADLIAQVSLLKIMIPEKFKDSFGLNDTKNRFECYAKTRRQILNEMKHCNLNANNFFQGIEKTKLSSQELNCLNFIIRGMTAKMIGKQLGISHRTVESHLENLKNKLNASSKSALIDKVMANIFNYLEIF